MDSIAGLGALAAKAKVWSFEYDSMARHDGFAVSGTGIRLARSPAGEQEVWVDSPNGPILMAAGAGPGARVFGSPGGTMPCYARGQRNRLRCSNVASNLLDRGETVRLKAFTVLQNMTGTPYPQDCLFADITMLEASGVYKLGDNGVEYETTKLTPTANATYDDAMEIVNRQWRDLAGDGRPLCVLVSGGYDSRLNLALALDAAKQFGNSVHLFHEYKNELEGSIARAVAEAVRLPLTVKTRTEFLSQERPIELSSDYIRLHSGTYRDNLIRWHHYFSYIKERHPDGLLIGFGAEAHKGKFYSQIHDLRPDSERVFGILPAVVLRIAERMRIKKFDANCQATFFDELCRHAAVYDQLSSQIDFCHYQTYIANGYGKRGHSVWQCYGFPFPFLRDDFLKIVFSMPRSEKEGFKIVTRRIGEVLPELLKVPFTSANEKSLAVKMPSAGAAASAVLKRLLRPAYRTLVPRDRKGRAGLHAAELHRLSSLTPQSEVTSMILEGLKAGFSEVPEVRIDYAMQVLLYLALLEEENGVEFTWS